MGDRLLPENSTNCRSTNTELLLPKVRWLTFIPPTYLAAILTVAVMRCSGFGWETTYEQCTTSFESTVVFSVDHNNVVHSDISYGPGQAWAWPIALVFAPSDLTTTTSSSTSAAASSTLNLATPPPTYTVTVTPSTIASGSSSHLSASAKAGAAVGAILGCALLLTVLGGILWYRRKNARTDSKVHPDALSEEKHEGTSSPQEESRVQSGAAANPAVPMLSARDAAELHGISQPPGLELVGSEIHQLPAPPPEIGGSEIHELPAED